MCRVLFPAGDRERGDGEGEGERERERERGGGGGGGAGEAPRDEMFTQLCLKPFPYNRASFFVSRASFGVLCFFGRKFAAICLRQAPLFHPLPLPPPFRPHHSVGLVVKASASRAEDPGFESCLRRDFFGVESYQ